MQENSWQIYKFGGSSLNDSDCILNVCNLIKENSSQNLIVVVSAMAGVTDQLVDYSESRNQSILDKIADRYRATINETIQEESIHEALLEEFSNDLKIINELAESYSEKSIKTEENQILGFGEIWSSRLIQGVLNEAKDQRDIHLLDPLEIITLCKTEMGVNVDWGESKKLFSESLSDKNGVFIMAGFIAMSSDSIATNLGRNGSDYSASIMGSLAEAESVSIWTDTDGIMTADPNQIDSAKTIEQMSYDEAIELAYFGAEVIHEKTMSPLIDKDIPIYIRNTFNPESKVTQISSAVGQGQSVKGITTIENITLVNIKVLE